MSVRLIEIEPNKWVVERNTLPPARSDLPCPMVISDTMDPTEQVDGRFYTSKSQFRKVGRSLGLIEIGNEKFPPKQRSTDLPETKRQRRRDIKTAVEKVQQGYQGP